MQLHVYEYTYTCQPFLNNDNQQFCQENTKTEAKLLKIISYHYRFGAVSLFNGISTFVGYLTPKLFSLKNSCSTI